MVESYELFTSNPCHSQLPVNSIRDGYTIDRFVALSFETGGISTHGSRQVSAVLPRDVVIPGIADIYARLDPYSTVLEMKGGVPLIEAWNEPITPRVSYDTTPLVTEVSIDSVDELIVNRSVQFNGQSGTVELSTGAITSLLESNRAVVPAQVGQKRQLIAVATRTTGRAPKEPRQNIVVTDLPQFLSAPYVSTAEGTLTAVKLRARNVMELRTTGTTEAWFGAGNTPVWITVRSPDPAPGPQLISEEEPAATQSQKAMRRDQDDPYTQAVKAASNFPVFELALYLPYQQQWNLLGYSRGALLTSLSLAPQEETTIEIFSWDRRKRSVERSTTSEFESTSDETKTVKDSFDVLTECTHNSEFHAEADGHLSIPDIGLTLGGRAGHKDAVQNITKSTHSHIQDTTTKASSRVKVSRQSKISESVELGREERVTRKVRNVNMCRALNIDYFEVLANYEVKTSFDANGARLCVLVDNPIEDAIDRRLLRLYEHILRPVLLAPSLAPGFDAARLLAARERICALACERCDCGAVGAGGSVDGAAAVWEEVKKSLLKLSPPFAPIRFSAPDGLYKIVWAGGDPTSALIEFHRWLYRRMLIVFAPGFYKLLDQLASDNRLADSKDFAVNLAFQIDALPEGFPDPTKIYAAQKDWAWKHEVWPSVKVWAQANNADWGNVQDFIWWHNYYDRFEDNGVAVLIAQFTAAYKAYTMAVADAAKGSDTVVADRAKRDDDASQALTDTYSAKDAAEAEEREEALLAHISSNQGYYRFALWRMLDPATQWELTPSRRLLAQLARPEAIGHVGTKLAFPIDTSVEPQLQQWMIDNVTTADLTTLTGVQNVVLPTPGVAVETRLGECDGCEDFIQKQRDIDLRLKTAQAAKEEQEAKRYEQRLAQHPPILSDPERDDAPIRVVLEQHPAKP